MTPSALFLHLILTCCETQSATVFFTTHIYTLSFSFASEGFLQPTNPNSRRPKAKVTVFIVGPSLKVRGGISSLIGTIMANCPEHLDYRMIATHTTCKGGGNNHPEPLRVTVQAIIYFIALMKLMAALAFFRNKAFHVHISQEGSTLRKGIICILLRVCRCRYLIHMHAAEDKLFHSWIPGFVRSSVLWGFRGCDRCLVLTQFWADYYSSRLSIAPDQLFVMPNPADIPSEIPDRDGRNRLNILFLGRIGARKGAFDLVRAFAMLSENVKQHCQLTLAGDGETQNAFRLAAVTGCTTQVTVTGWLDRSDVVQLLRDSDVLVLPSYAEGMALSVLEAMAWGLAVITTDSGGSTSFLQDRHNCLLVKPGDVIGIHDAIRALYDDSDMRLHLGRTARITAEGLSIDRYVSTLSLIYCDAGEAILGPSAAACGGKPTLTHSLTK